MKAIFNKEALLKKLNKAFPFIPKKVILPAHEAFLFRIDQGGVLSITALDGEKQITVSCPSEESDTPMQFCIHARVLVKTLELMLEEKVSFTKKSLKSDIPGKCTIEIKSGKSKYRMQCDDGSVYPLMQPIKSEFEASFTGSDFNITMETVVNYANEANSYAANEYICLRSVGNTINAYACSNSDLSKVVMSPRSINKWDDILISTSSIKAISKCINDIDIVDIIHNKDKIEIRTEEVSVIALAQNMKYPDMDLFFNKKPSTKVRLNTVEFFNAIKRLHLYANEEVPLIKINIATAQITMDTVNDAYAREGDETIDTIAEKEIVFACSSTLLIKALSQFKNDEFELSYSEPKIMIFIDPIDSIKDNNKFFAIMPSVM